MNSYAAFRSAAEIPDHDWEPPTVRVLWNKTPMARRPHLCCICGEEIAAGTRYESVGVLIDGDFEATKQHLRTTDHVSGCPRFAERDKAELAAQFAADKAAFFPEGAPVSSAQPSKGSEPHGSTRGQKP